MIEAMPKPAMPAASTPRARGTRAMPSAATTPTTRMTQRSAGYHVGLHPRMTKAQAMVARMAAARASRGKTSRRRRHRVEAPMPDQGADGRGQGDRVVRVDDPVGEAEDGPGQQQPAPEDEEAGPDPVGPRGAAGQPQDGDQTDQRPGDQPRDLAAHRGEEQAVPSGRAPHAPGGATRHRRCRSRCRSAGRSRCSRR